jgi:hypothetical protein
VDWSRVGSPRELKALETGYADRLLFRGRRRDRENIADDFYMRCQAPVLELQAASAGHKYFIAP